MPNLSPYIIFLILRWHISVLCKTSIRTIALFSCHFTRGLNIYRWIDFSRWKSRQSGKYSTGCGKNSAKCHTLSNANPSQFIGSLIYPGTKDMLKPSSHVVKYVSICTWPYFKRLDPISNARHEQIYGFARAHIFYNQLGAILLKISLCRNWLNTVENVYGHDQIDHEASVIIEVMHSRYDHSGYALLHVQFLKSLVIKKVWYSWVGLAIEWGVP